MNSEMMLRASHNMEGAAAQMQRTANQVSDEMNRLNSIFQDALDRATVLVERLEKVMELARCGNREGKL